MKKIDIVVPVMNEEEVIPLFYEAVKGVAGQINSYEISFLFVDDGSTDGTLSELKALAQKDPFVKYLSFSRNFGKESAIFAGLTHAKGDRVILMDGDLEHPPELIPQMLRAVDEEGFEACGAKRQSSLSSRMYANLNNKMSAVKLEKGATDYMCMTRKFLDAVLRLTETQRFTKGLFAWVGFNVKWIDYEQPVRPKGKSKWSFKKLFNYAADGLTSFSTMPLRIVTFTGVIVCLLAFIYIIITLIHTLVTGIEVPGYVTTLVVLLFLGGVIILAVGILGEYIGRIYLESKDRPMYILNQTNIGDRDLPPAEAAPAEGITEEAAPAEDTAEAAPAEVEPAETTPADETAAEAAPAEKPGNNNYPSEKSDQNEHQNP